MSDFSVYNNIGKTFPMPASRSNATCSETGSSFSEVLKDAIQNVNQLEHGAQVGLQKVSSEQHDFNSTMMSLEQVDVSFQVMMQVRNRIVEAYQEIMRTEV
jgi:flagellar hook-basal body complex protein FliE